MTPELRLAILSRISRITSPTPAPCPPLGPYSCCWRRKSPLGSTYAASGTTRNSRGCLAGGTWARLQPPREQGV